MTFTSNEILMLQESWNKVSKLGDDVGLIFYNRLFDQYPQLKPLFKENMRTQTRKLLRMLNSVILNLDDLNELIPEIVKLGKKHINYDVQNNNYQMVGETLIWTLQQGLGEEFTPQLEDLWIEAYTIISSVMIKGSANLVSAEIK